MTTIHLFAFQLRFSLVDFHCYCAFLPAQSLPRRVFTVTCLDRILKVLYTRTEKQGTNMQTASKNIRLLSNLYFVLGFEKYEIIIRNLYN